MAHLIPAYLPILTESDVDNICTYYGKLLLYEEQLNFSTELARWKNSNESIAIQDQPESASIALSECSPQIFPALKKCLPFFLLHLWVV